MEIDAKSPEGNVNYIMAVVSRLLEDSGRGDQVKSAMERMRSGNYDNACKVAEEVTYGSIVVVNRDAMETESAGDG